MTNDLGSGLMKASLIKKPIQKALGAVESICRVLKWMRETRRSLNKYLYVHVRYASHFINGHWSDVGPLCQAVGSFLELETMPSTLWVSWYLCTVRMWQARWRYESGKIIHIQMALGVRYHFGLQIAYWYISAVKKPVNLK